MNTYSSSIWRVIAAVSVLAVLILLWFFSTRYETASFTQNAVSPVINSALPIVDEPIQPINAPFNLDQEKIRLGEMLFHDKQLSADNSVSCSSCHLLQAGGSDNLSLSIGVNGLSGDVNSPTVFNAALNISQFWDGRAETLDSQIDWPVHNPNEMGSSWAEIIDKLESNKAYNNLFNELYKDGITVQTIKESITTFERSLVTVEAPFDRFLLGDEHAISENAKIGYELFKEYGCVACHQGSNVGGNLYQRLGIMGDYFADRGTGINSADLGRYNVTGLEEDKYVFRVPSLRLSPLTAPYFHDGSAATLKQAVRVMIKYQLGRMSSEQDEDLIIEFLNSLVGNYKGQRLTE